MLKSNPASFEFKTAIRDSRKQVVFNEWLDDSKNIPYEIKYLENIKSSNYTILNKSLKELKQLTFTDSSIIHSDFNFSIPSRNNDLTATIYIFDKRGLLKEIIQRWKSDWIRFHEVWKCNKRRY